MLFRRRGLGFGRRGFNFHFGRRSSNGFGMYNRRGGRKTGIIIGVILAILVILLVLVFSIRIKDVEVSGNKQYTKEQIESLLFDGKWSRNSAFCYYQNRFKEHKSIPFIEEYKINFKSPTKVEVVVFEKSVVGCVSYMSSYMYFDKDGIIVESSSEQLPGVPVITGLEFGHIVLHHLLFHFRIHDITDTIAQQVETDNGHEDKRACGSRNVRGGCQTVTADTENAAPGCGRKRDAESEEA